MRTTEINSNHISSVQKNKSLLPKKQSVNAEGRRRMDIGAKTQSISDDINIEGSYLQQRLAEQELAAQEKRAREEAAELRISQQMMEMYHQQAEAAEKGEEMAVDMAKIMEIARRISNGHKVPASDEKKLLEYNPKLYMASKNAGTLMNQKKRKKYKALFEDDKEKDMRDQIRELNRHSEDDTIVIAEKPAGGEASAEECTE